MDKGQFIDIGEFDETSVDCSEMPQSAEQYLKQVMVSRNRCPDVVRAHVLPKAVESKAVNVQKKVKDVRCQPLEWQQAKAEDFAEKRKQFLAAKSSFTKLKIKLPHLDDEDAWKELILDRCHPELEKTLKNFPNHVATPPTASLIASMSPTLVNTLIPYIVDWASSESFIRPLREWLYSLMLVVELPLLHDVVAALRDVTKMCKSLRSNIAVDRTEDIMEMSFFIAVVSMFFGQKDLGDE